MGTRYVGPVDEVTALDAFIALSRASKSVMDALSHQHKAFGDLTVTQFAVMEALLHLGPLSQRQLAGKVLKTTGNLVTVIDNLERRRLVVRRRSATDRRITRIELTTKGRRLISQMFPGHVAAITAAMGALSEAEQRELKRLCKVLGLAQKKEA